MERITMQCTRILRKIEAREFKKSKGKYCNRGLEGHTELGSIKKRRNRLIATAVVLREQERQWKNGREVDAQAIADVYRRTTSNCQKWAHVIGKRDQMAAETYFHQNENCKELINVPATKILEWDFSCVSTYHVTLA